MGKGGVMSLAARIDRSLGSIWVSYVLVLIIFCMGAYVIYKLADSSHMEMPWILRSPTYSVWGSYNDDPHKSGYSRSDRFMLDRDKRQVYKILKERKHRAREVVETE